MTISAKSASAGVVLLIASAAAWWYFGRGSESGSSTPGSKGGGAPVTVTTTTVVQRDLPVIVTANGTVVSLQSVDIKAQITGTVKTVHIAEGQSVRAGDVLISLDSRNEEAALRRAEAQVQKTRADLANAERNLRRQRELFEQKFISQSALDTAVTALDLLKGQLSVDEAAADSARVAQSLMVIRAPFAGRTGSISVRAGSVVVPNGGAMLSLAQVDPIGVSFALPEREFPNVQREMAKGKVQVEVSLPSSPSGEPPVQGTLVLFENAVDATTGTIGMKASIANNQSKLWPGMFANVSVNTRTLKDALLVPIQAVQSGPERQFVYVVEEGGKARAAPVTVDIMQQGLAAVRGLSAGARVVVEGGQSVRNGGTVKEASDAPSAKSGKAKKGDSSAPASAASKS